MFQTFLQLQSHLVLVLGLLVAHLIGLRPFQVVSYVLGRGELPPHFNLILHFLGLALKLDIVFVVYYSSQSYLNIANTLFADL